MQSAKNTKFIRAPKLKVLFSVIFLAIFAIGCEPSVITLPKKVKKDSYSFDNKIIFKEMTTKPWNSQEDFEAYLANVNYDTRDNSMIFLNTVTLAQKVVPHDIWDIAIVADKTQPFVVANSGDYGRGVKFKQMPSNWTPQNAIGSHAVDIRNVSFAEHKKNPTPYQEDANPLRDALKNGAWYMVTSWNNTFTDMQVFAFRFKPIPEPKIGSKIGIHFVKYKIRQIGASGNQVDDPYKTIESIDPQKNYQSFYLMESYSIIDNFSMIYFDLANQKIINGGSSEDAIRESGIPTRNDWHIMFNRTDFYSKEMGELFKNDGIVGDSSILINTQGGVEVAPMYGWDFPEVKQIPKAVYFSNKVDVIGGGYVNPVAPDLEKLRKAWYYGENMPPTFFLNQNTYVIKSPIINDENKIEDVYVKFRPGTFYGPNGEKFYTRFRAQAGEKSN